MTDLNRRGRLSTTCVLVLLGLTASMGVLAQSDQEDRISESTTVLREIMGAPDSGIPDWAPDNAEAVASALIVGGILA